MTDEQLAGQIKSAVGAAALRASRALEAGHVLADIVATSYLSGANQAASMLVRGDGEITAQQIERALMAVGIDMGYALRKDQTT